MNGQFPREAILAEARLFQQCELYHQQVAALRRMITTYPETELSEQQKTMLQEAYRNLLRPYRVASVALDEQSQSCSSETQKQAAIRIKQGMIETKIQAICEQFINLIDSALLPNCKDELNKVQYYKSKGDAYRYICGIVKQNKQMVDAMEKADDAYRRGLDIARMNLPADHVTTLSLGLNYAIFCHEIQGLYEKGAKIAQETVQMAKAHIVKYQEEEYDESKRQARAILEVLRQNINLWESERKSSVKDSGPVRHQASLCFSVIKK